MRLKKAVQIIYTFALIALLFSCANPGNPSGGPKDEDPPILEKSAPLLNQKNFSGTKVELFFDEIVVLKDARKNFIISPPLETEPEINALGKKVVIKLNNELQPNTTYTVYLNSTIVDNNEGNPLENFTFSFSTGEVIDTMAISGTVIKAEDLEPQAGVIVGIYANLDDSAFINNVPLRIAKTDDEGKFTVKNIAPGTYKIYALKEPIKNYRFDVPGEEIAFLDTVYVPFFDSIQVSDTLWVDSVTVDTVIWRDTLIYGPDDILLQTFQEFNYTQNLRKKERSVPYQLLFSFSEELVEEPRLHILGTEKNYGGVFPEFSVTRDTILYWLTDSLLYNNDTLLVELQYQKTDSLEQLYWQLDTIQMIYRRPKTSSKKNKSTVKKYDPLSFTSNTKSNLDYEGTIVFSFDEPIELFDKSEIQLYLKADTLKNPIRFTLARDSLFPRKFYINSNWEGGEDYELLIDSAAIENIYGKVSDKVKLTFKVTDIDKYGHITFNLKTINAPGILYLLNGNGKPVRSTPFTAGQKSLSFELVKPGKYYFKLFYDLNENGLWDTGNFMEHQQPEPVRFFHKELEIKAYRDYEEDWDTELLPLDKQKPKALKGKEEKKR